MTTPTQATPRPREGSGGVSKALVEQFFGDSEGGDCGEGEGAGGGRGEVFFGSGKGEGAGGGRGEVVFGSGEGEGVVFFGALTVVLSKGAFSGGGGVIEGALALPEALA
ncbi:hypothetical protein Syun_009682 [Stephania yunnanensis]|uniref:Uncharacterized protein n=1 Tax=Stephania yunnanensis TaxID=152371 RepID=A0AAP0PNT4_9MAGN